MKCFIIGQELNFDAEEIIFNKVRLLIKWGIKEFYSRGMTSFEKICEKTAKIQGAKVIRDKKSDMEEYNAFLCNFYDCEEGEKCLGEIDESVKIIINICL